MDGKTELSQDKTFKNIVKSLREGTKDIWVQGLWDSSRTYFISAVFKKLHAPCLVIGYGEEESELLYQELETFLPHVEIFSPEEKMSLLAKLLSKELLPFVIVTSIQTLLETIPPPEHLARNTLEIKKGDTASIEEVREHLLRHNYERANEVIETGEFSPHGCILDVFPPQEKTPFRIEFGEKKVESIRRFNPGTQRSTEKVKSCSFFPAKLSAGQKLSTLLAYVPGETIIFMDEPIYIREKTREVAHISGETEDHPINYERLIRTYRKHTVIYLSLLPQKTPEMKPEKTYELSILSTECKACQFDSVAQKIRKWIDEKFTIIFYCNNDGEKKRLIELLSEHGIKSANNMDFRIGYLRGGFVLTGIKLIFLSDQEIFGRYRRRITRRVRGLPIQLESELTPGDYVVHLDHGIGKYLKLENLQVDGRDCEFLAIEYAGEDKLYVPPSHIHLIEKYIGIEGKPPPVYKLGGSSWRLAKQRAVKAVQDIAGELLELYAMRQISNGIKFSTDTAWQHEFESAFLYEETRDQLKTVEEVKADMESPESMNRLICGDSGYGKTEIAMRAAFKAAMDGKQTAVLVPTTILAEQHYTVFSERMADYPVNIAVLSRFKTETDQKEVIAGLRKGIVDIVIGTHRLIQKDISFRNLGLVIVDEEQRFGVAQKEKLKRLRKTVDVLTMSATPIPRTLYMSLMGVRDISIINSPPDNRLPVESRLIPFDKKLIRNAILKEIERDGQVFYVHNRVESINMTRDAIEKLVPEARTEIAHGQMSEKELEKVMRDFTAAHVDVLVCTTIIESGLDIPNANTIIIEKASSFGLADLYQLRGRVGRYKHKAYAFFIIPGLKPVTNDAKKRLKAIEELGGHGAGFHLAMRDLEIRGAGNLLGREQHGHVIAIGFDLYCKLLKETILELKGERIDKSEPIVELGVEFSIPSSFIPEGRSRIKIYRKMAAITDMESLRELREELCDRYGTLPPTVMKLLKALELKAKAQESGISYLGVDGNNVRIRFRDREESSTYRLTSVGNDREMLDEIGKVIDSKKIG